MEIELLDSTTGERLGARRRVAVMISIHFPFAWAYWGEWRCDLHPRASNNGRGVAIDSPHAGGGRQVHLIDVGALLDGSDA